MGVDFNTWYNEGNIALIEGLNVFYKRSGRGQTLICIHGFPTSSWDYQKMWPALTAHFEVVASDLIGLGRSSKPKTAITVNMQADMIERLVLGLGITQAHILTHDLGDTVAQELLARQYETHRPRLIQKLLISPLGPLVARLVTKKTFNKNMIAIFSRQHPPDAEFLHQSWMLLVENNGISMMPRLIQYMSERRTKRERWVTPLVKGLVPLRLINGTEDPISGEHAAHRYGEIIPHADIVLLQNSGHYPHLETPNEVLKAFFEFHKMN